MTSAGIGTDRREAMRLGWLVDPRTHLTSFALFFGALLTRPEMGEVASTFERVAFESLDRIGHDARVTIGVDECPGHFEAVEGQPGRFLHRPCPGSEPERALGIY
jgi:hypothetical protein